MHTLRGEADQDWRSVDAQLFGWADDPRGEDYGQSWQPLGDPIRVSYQEVLVNEAQVAGRQESRQTMRLLFDLGPAPEYISPVSERMQIDLPRRDGSIRRYDITQSQTVISNPDYGVVAEAVSA